MEANAPKTVPSFMSSVSLGMQGVRIEIHEKTGAEVIRNTLLALRQLVDSQRLQMEQLTKNYEEQTLQLNQTIANLNETVEHLKKKLFASSSERAKTDAFPGQMDLFNEAEAAADTSIPEPALEMAVGGYKRQVRKPKATREEILAGLPIMEVPCMVPDDERLTGHGLKRSIRPEGAV